MPEKDTIRSAVSRLPDKPGVYQFLDASGTILYVGKARSLRKRVASYFAKNQSGKTQVMLSRAADLLACQVRHDGLTHQTASS